jgi:hypothetical protein
MEAKNGGGLSSSRRSSGVRRKWGGEGRGFSSSFIGAEGASGRVAGVVIGGVNGFNAIKDRARLRRVQEGS